jgi:hypothetical protein
MAKRHPVINPQFMKAIKMFILSFKKKDSKQEIISQHKPVYLNSPLAYEYRKYVENRF